MVGAVRHGVGQQWRLRASDIACIADRSNPSSVYVCVCGRVCGKISIHVCRYGGMYVCGGEMDGVGDTAALQTLVRSVMQVRSGRAALGKASERGRNAGTPSFPWIDKLWGNSVLGYAPGPQWFVE